LTGGLSVSSFWFTSTYRGLDENGNLLDEDKGVGYAYLIYPTEVIGIRNLAGVRLVADIGYVDGLEAFEVSVGFVSLYFVNWIWSGVLNAGTHNIRLHDDDFSGDFSSSAESYDFLVIRLKAVNGRVSFNDFKVYAITTAPPNPDYSNYLSFYNNQVLRNAQQQATVSTGEQFDGTPLEIKAVQYTYQKKDGEIVNMTGYELYELTSGDADLCQCCCNGTDCAPFDVQTLNPITVVYDKVENEAILRGEGDSVFFSGGYSSYVLSMPYKTFRWDWSVLTNKEV